MLKENTMKTLPGTLLLSVSLTSWSAETAALPSWSNLDQSISALQQTDVAWRGIEWKTCMIDALHTARKEKKPIVVWMFIDRPIDDKRC
ncbi:MAG: hypothetical protein ACI9TH_003498 [Kiritimatiellia bacterium]|jgi:hypothetical protein